MPSQTNVASFVVRFVQETVDNADRSSGRQHPSEATTDFSQAGWHGVIKHVQTGTEQHFTDLAGAIIFMTRYVKLGDFSGIIELETGDSDCTTPNPESRIPNPE
jgi:hypothetical protein